MTLSPTEQTSRMSLWVLQFLAYSLAVQLQLAVDVLSPSAGQCRHVVRRSEGEMKSPGVQIQ